MSEVFTRKRKDFPEGASDLDADPDKYVCIYAFYLDNFQRGGGKWENVRCHTQAVRSALAKFFMAF